MTKIGPINLIFLDNLDFAQKVTTKLALVDLMVSPVSFVYFDDIRMNAKSSAQRNSITDIKLELPEMYWTVFSITFRYM